MDSVTLTSSIDMVPTVLHLLNLPQPDKLEGISLLNHEGLKNRNSIFSEVYYHDMNNMLEPSKNLKYRVIVHNEWKLILPYKKNLQDTPPELYNILKDPYEKRNLRDGNIEKIKDLTMQLNDWWKP